LVTKQEVLDVLKNVMDPELGMDIVTLEMVREVVVEGSDVKVVLALTTDTCPLASRLRRDTEVAVKGLRGVGSVDVQLTVMNEEERNRLIEKLKAKGRPGPPSPQAPTKLPKGRIKRIIAVVSGKGGVGKSSVASMLAVEASRMGLKAGVLDADITGPSIPKMFGEMVAPFAMEERIIPGMSKGGVKIISMNLLTGEEDTAVIWRGPLVSGAIRQFYTDVDWGELDCLVVDLPPGTSDAQLTVMQLLPLDGAVVVTSPQDLASMIVSKAVNMSKAMNVPIIGVIENMSHVKCPRCGEIINIYGEPKGQILAEKIGAKFLGSMPIDPSLSKACDEGKIEDYHSPEFHGIAEKVLE
jgi:Mrp family chromosome partitioning ATPase